MTAAATTSVLIVGAGPAGLTLANLLGAEGVSTVLVERNAACVPEPRAVALDGESLRTLQAAGLADTVTASIRQGFVADYINGAGVHLFSTDLTARPYGFCLQNSFDQPTLERQLLAGLSRFPCVNVSYDTEMLSFEQDGAGVSAVLRDGAGAEHTLHTRFMVGCDGGRSSVRQGLGIAMRGDRLPQQWLVIDTVDTHLGEEPGCRFFCDPLRPGMTIIRPGAERRWEWMLVHDERAEDMLEDTRIRELLAGHTDPDRVRVYRKCVYSFSAVVAERFNDGRVFLAGDAAHMTPPFAGQGLNAGIRDVRNLSWKLARVLAGTLPHSLLASYDTERLEAAKAMIGLAVALGDQIQPTEPEAATARDEFFATLNEDPAAATKFGTDAVAPLSDVRLPRGWFAQGGSGGRMLPQPRVRRGGGEILLDELLGPGFVALVHDRPGLPATVTSHPLWRALAPTVREMREIGNPEPLADFISGDSAGITLVRPDRFVLAQLRGDAGAVEILDALLTAVSDAA